MNWLGGACARDTGNSAESGVGRTATTSKALAALDRSGARCRSRERRSLVMLPESCRFWPQVGNLRFPVLTKDVSRLSNHAPHSVAVSSRGVAARAGRGTCGPSRSSAHGADCQREPQAPSLLASSGHRRAPLALSVRQDSIDRPAETGSPVSAYLNTALNSYQNLY